MPDHPLKQRITDGMKDAMRAKDKPRLSVLRLILSEIKRVEVDERIDMADDRVIGILDKMVKQRRESIKQYEAGGRQELADLENSEISVIQEFMPEAMDEAEIAAIVDEAISATGAASMKEMGAVMNVVRPKLAGRADMAVVSKLVKEKLA
ncbi:MAG: GatB/YqeY domain-containing protein [Pseudohongiellaceae bacterium]